MLVSTYECGRCWHEWASVGDDLPKECPECGVKCWASGAYDVCSDARERIVIHLRGGQVVDVECPPFFDVQVVTDPLYDLANEW